MLYVDPAECIDCGACEPVCPDMCRTAPRRTTVQFDDFIEAVAERADTSRGEAQALVRATLRTLAERISGGEAEDLRAQLPRELKGDLISPEENAQGFDVDEFVRRVAERTGLDETDAGARVAAVLSVLRDAVSPGEFDDVIGQLGREFAELIEAADHRGSPAGQPTGAPARTREVPPP
jgi:uncharacterized protein (DUF2267 family)